MTDAVRLMFSVSAPQQMKRSRGRRVIRRHIKEHVCARIAYNKHSEECEDTSFIYSCSFIIILQHTLKVLSSAGFVKLIFLKQTVWMRHKSQESVRRI